MSPNDGRNRPDLCQVRNQRLVRPGVVARFAELLGSTFAVATWAGLVRVIPRDQPAFMANLHPGQVTGDVDEFGRSPRSTE